MGSDAKPKIPGVGLGKELLWDWIKGGLFLLAPTVPAVIAAGNGFMRDLPLWAIITSTALIVASVLTTIRAYVEVTHRLRVRGRLAVANATALVKTKTPGGAMSHLGIGLNIVNQAAQPLEYEVVNVSLVIDGRVNPHPTWKNHKAVIPMGAVVLFRTDLVPIAAARSGRSYDFTYEIAFDYGQPGNLKHRLDVKLRGAFLAKSPSELELFESFNA